ncbi:late endosomal/lysosomal adaptor MAPK and MTOR activator 5 [Cricetulus griseus]
MNLVPLETPSGHQARSNHVTQAFGEAGSVLLRDPGVGRIAGGMESTLEQHLEDTNIMIQKHDGITVAVHKMAS